MYFQNFFLSSRKRVFVFVIVLMVFCIYLVSCFDHKSSSYNTFIIAQRNIAKGELLSFENTTLSNFDLSKSSSHFILNTEFEELRDTVAKDDIPIHQPILKSNLQNVNTIENQIPKGKRLFILDIPIGPIVSLLKPNDSIDLIAQIDMPGLSNITETILEGVHLVEVDDHAKEGYDNIKYLSFYLTPDEVKILSFIKPYSQFAVALRNPDDAHVGSTRPMTFNQFIQNEKIQKIINAESFRIINGRSIKPFSQQR